MLIISAPRFEQHITPPGHPERAERAHVFAAVSAEWAEREGRVCEPRPASRTELERVHTSEYLDRVEALAGQVVMLDPDTFTSPESVAIALLAAGAAVQAAEHAVNTGEPAFALVRPPGHHAEPDRAMGFCLLNNVAVAAAAMLDRGLSRIAVLDFDVHHGNGTQDMFYRDPRVLYISTHQYPFYPGTGAASEIGEAEGRGYTANVPMEAGSTDEDYALVYRAIIEPLLDAFQPELLLVSAGYDAHERDPLASMRVTTEGYAAMVRRLKARGNGAGPLAFVTEGGYDLPALAACLRQSIDVLAQPHSQQAPSDAAERNVPAGATARGERAVVAARGALAPFWNGI
jgi:acetoin utilization deacetylase AcuC-like enzyme